MPHYRTDLLESGEPIDVIEFQARHPQNALPPDPRILEELMGRDVWERGEALLILAGFQLGNDTTGGHGIPCVLGNIGVGCSYLDGTNDKALQLKGLTHPLKGELQGNYRALRWYAQGQPLAETKEPKEWLAWAKSKGYKADWLGYWREHLGENVGSPQGETTLSGYDLLGFETLQEHQWNGGAIDYERWTEKSDKLIAAHAARLMSGLDPEKFADLKLVRIDAAGPAKQCALRFEQLATANDPPKERDTPIGWLIWADKKREKVHGPFRAFVVATQKEQASIDELERAAFAALRERYQEQEDGKRAAGRYTLEEAAQAIAENTGERAEDLQTKLVQAVADRLLTVYRPGEKQTYKPKTVRWFYEEAYWYDLNEWLAANESLITWRFPAQVQADADSQRVPCSESTKPGNDDKQEDTDKGLKKRERQIQAIENAADASGYNRLKIPDGGKTLLMEKCKKKYPELFGGGDCPFFDAWKEAVKHGRIRMRNHERYSRR